MFENPGKRGGNRVEMPGADVRSMIARTAMSIGIDENLAFGVGQAAWVLTNRGIDGVTYAWVYLTMTRDMPAERRNLRRGDRGEPRIACPIAASAWLSGAPDPFRLTSGSDRIVGGVVAPLLVLPFLVYQRTVPGGPEGAVRVRFSDQSVVMHNGGLIIESPSLANLLWVFAPDGIDVVVSFTDPAAVTDGVIWPTQRFETLWVSKNRLRDDGLLDLS
jgi:hypothetical protein